MLNFAQIGLLVNAVYDPSYAAILQRATNEGFQLPSVTQRELQNNLVGTLKSSGIWNRLDYLFIAAHDAGENFCRIDWKNPNGTLATIVDGSNNLVHVKNVGFLSFTTSSPSAYINTGWSPSSGPNYTQNDSSYFLQTTTDYIRGSDVIAGAATIGANNRMFFSPTFGGNRFWTLNQSAGVDSFADTVQRGFYHADRVISTEQKLYRNGTLIRTATVTSAAVPAVPVYLLAENVANVAATISTSNISCFGAGASLNKDDLYSAWNTYYNAINPTGVQIGTILNDSFARLSLGSSYSTIGASTWTCDGTELTVSGGVGTTTHRMRYLYGNSFDECVISMRVRLVSAPSASTFGIGIGFADFSSPDAETTVYGSMNFTTGGGASNVVSWNGTTLSVRATSPGSLVRTAGDYYQFVLTKSIVDNSTLRYSLVVTKESDLSTQTVSWVESAQAGNSTGYFSVFSLGGTYAITNLTISVQDKKQIRDLFIGDSITSRYSPSTIRKRFANLSSDSVTVSAGPGDVTQRVLDKIQSCIDTDPDRVFLMIGGNDVAFSVASGTWQANYQSIVNQLNAAGIEVIHLLATPRNSVDITPVNTWINSTYTGIDQIIDTYTPLWSGSGTGLHATYNSGDGVHPNQLGHYKIAETIISNI